MKINLFKALRIIFCILAVAGAAAAIFVFAYAHWIWGVSVVAAALIFAALMFLFKNLQTKEETKANPPPLQGDFIMGRVADNNSEK